MELGNFFQVPVNYLAVLLSAVSSMIIGFIWYGPLFGNEWQKLVGFTPEKIAKAKKNTNQNNTLMFISSFAMAWILFHFIWYAAPANFTFLISIKVAVYSWIFIAAAGFTKFLFSSEKSTKLLFIETGYQLVSLIAMSIIIFLLK